MIDDILGVIGSAGAVCLVVVQFYIATVAPWELVAAAICALCGTYHVMRIWEQL